LKNSKNKKFWKNNDIRERKGNEGGGGEPMEELRKLRELNEEGLR